MMVCAYSPRVGAAELGGSLCTLGSQSSLLGNFQANGQLVSKKGLRKDTLGGPLKSTHMLTHMHVELYTCAPLNKQTHIQITSFFF